MELEQILDELGAVGTASSKKLNPQLAQELDCCMTDLLTAHDNYRLCLICWYWVWRLSPVKS
jgi:hypothetical protein